jgi:hypothetical protein
VGESGGKLRFGGHRDVEDISVLPDYLAERESVQTDASDDPRVGIEGTSAGGWRALRGASRDDRIDALLCRSTPYDAAASIGTGGVLKWPWTYSLYLGVRAGPVRPTEEFPELTEQAVDSRELTEEPVEFLQERSPAKDSVLSNILTSPPHAPLVPTGFVASARPRSGVTVPSPPGNAVVRSVTGGPTHNRFRVPPVEICLSMLSAPSRTGNECR